MTVAALGALEKGEGRKLAREIESGLVGEGDNRVCPEPSLVTSLLSFPPPSFLPSFPLIHFLVEGGGQSHLQ